MTDLSRYLKDQHHTGSTWRLYGFPSGRTASVIPDPRPEHPFRFEVQVDDEQPRRGLASADVEDLLTALALAEPGPEPTVAWVTVDDNGHLILSKDGQPGSTVTVGNDTWPVPNKVAHGGVLWMSRVGYALREFGWRPVRGADHDLSTPGVIGVPVEQIETNDG